MSSLALTMSGAEYELWGVDSTKSYSALASPVNSSLGMVFFGSALRCGGESSSSSPSRALPSESGAIASAAGRGCQTQVESRQ